METKKQSVIIGAALFLAAAVPGFGATVGVLGSADDFAVLGASTVTNTGTTLLVGSTGVTANLGVYPGLAVSGLGPGANEVIFTNGVLHAGDAVAQQAQVDVLKAYTALALLAPTGNLTGQDLGNFNTGNLGALAPGVYSFASSAAITGKLQLDAQHTDGAYWVFQIPSTLTTAASNSLVELINANVTGNNGSDVGVYWVVGSAATLGVGTTFEGNILAQASVTLNTNAVIKNGRALAMVGAVTMDNNSISDLCVANNNGPGFNGGLVFASETSTTLIPIPVPEPSILGILGLGLITLCGSGRRPKFTTGSV